MVPSCLNCAIDARLPDHEVWVQAYKSDTGTKLLLSFASDPSLVTVKSILDMYCIYRYSVRNGLIYDRNRILFRQELSVNDYRCIKLQVIP